jgi:hypothetical protein
MAAALASAPTPIGVPTVDVPAAKEVIEQVNVQLTVPERGALVDELAVKARSMRAYLRAENLDAEGARAAIALTFVGRRAAREPLRRCADIALCELVKQLLDESQPLTDRFERFCTGIPLTAALAAELAGELLHFTDPERYWLWSRWIWSPARMTGALPLLIGEEFTLRAEGSGATYARVGEATRALDISPEAGAFQLGGGGRLGTDVLLACTYAVYMRTALGMKLTQEFTTIVPPMAALVRRLLGTYTTVLGEVG